MTSKSKSKGNAFEREMRDMLNDAFNCKEFARTPSSGAIMGRSNYQKNQHLEDHTKTTLGSDIICPSWFNFSIECKSYKDSPNHSTIMRGNDTTLDRWISETLFDAINFKQTPLIFFKTTRKGTFAVLPYHFEVIINGLCTHYLKYNEFVVVGIDSFRSIVEPLNAINNDTETFNSIQKWLQQSPYVQAAVASLDQKK